MACMDACNNTGIGKTVDDGSLGSLDSDAYRKQLGVCSPYHGLPTSSSSMPASTSTSPPSTSILSQSRPPGVSDEAAETTTTRRCTKGTTTDLHTISSGLDTE
ncbi:hypothetical protein BYT27DRAFT_7203136 [Phlegmacium glaucopus]|nr:hypothetical protein BYT27DRAFT_7203136 [Phlegmacium glaucopus]